MDSDWLAQHLFDAKLKVIEVGLEPDTAYAQSHIPGAYLISWKADLSGNDGTEFVNRKEFERLMSSIGVIHDTGLVLYSDYDNLLAIFAFWIFQYFGHDNVKILFGGRDSWTETRGSFTRMQPQKDKRSEYFVRELNDDVRPDFLKASRRIMDFVDPSCNNSSLGELGYAE